MLKTIKADKGFDIIFLVKRKIVSFDKTKVKKNLTDLKKEIEFCL